jgi:hypothetical protein
MYCYIALMIKYLRREIYIYVAYRNGWMHIKRVSIEHCLPIRLSRSLVWINLSMYEPSQVFINHRLEYCLG